MKILPRLGSLVLALLLFPLVALAQPVLDPGAADFDLTAILKLLEGGVQSKNWGVVIVGVLIGVVWLIRFAAKKFPNLSFLAWTRTTWGGWGLNLGGSLVAAVGVLIMRGGVTGSSVMSAIIAAVVTGFASAGALEFKKDLIASSKAEGAAAGLAVVTKKDALDELK